MKKKLQDDICMWISIIIIIFCIAIIRDNINKKNDYELNNKNKIVAEIRKSAEEIEKNEPDFYIPNDYYMEYKNKGMLADRIEIKNYKMSNDFKTINYTLKNNYDFDVLITPELTDEIDSTDMNSMQLLYYDFNYAYKILKPGEEIDLQINTTSIEREKVNKSKFKAYRVIYKYNNERDVVGYIQIGGEQ